MATTPEMQAAVDGVHTPQNDDHPAWETIKRALRPIASLKLTVVLLALAIFNVLAGTLAQVDADIWVAVDTYFRIDPSAAWGDEFPWLNLGAFFVIIDSRIFFPPSFFPDGLPDGLGWLAEIRFPFPKGWLIGLVMLLNLDAAHLVRFKKQASGARLWGGLSVISVGCLVTALVVLSGSSAGGFQTEYWISWNLLWGLLQVGLMTTGAAALYGAATLPKEQNITRMGLGLTTLLIGGVLAWTFLATDAQPNESSMRILYQLVKATLASLVLLAGCVMVFRKRAGIVVIHTGVGLMMISELIVGLQAEEAQLRIEEGASRNFVEDTRTAEMAFVQTLEDGRETHTVVPASIVKRADEGPAISDDELPVDIEVLEYLQNSDLVYPQELLILRLKDELPSGQQCDWARSLSVEECIQRLQEWSGRQFGENVEAWETWWTATKRQGGIRVPRVESFATKGIGIQQIAVPVRASTGTDTGGGVDQPSAYVRLTHRDSGEDLGTWLVSTHLDPLALGWDTQTIRVDDHDYNLDLRFKRSYKPYIVTLNDVRKEDYIGTSTPRDYSSFVRLVDESSGTDRDDVRIWMNNPLRYGGETFYQSGYFEEMYRGSPEWTSLQVVKNRGWMIPYVACMIVVVGMCFHFLLVLRRFLDRRQREVASSAVTIATSTDTLPALVNWGLPAAVVLIFAGYLGSKTRMPESPDGHLDLMAFRNVPVVYEGRPKPIDTLARNSLLIVSDRQEFTGRMDPQTWQENWEEISETLREEWPELSSDDLEPFREGDQPLADLVDVIVEEADADRQEAADFVYDTTSERQPAVRWLLDVITGMPAGREHRVFRIENLDLLATLGLPRRHRFRYALEEIEEEKLADFMEQLQEAESSSSEDLTFYQRKVLELANKLKVFQRLHDAFSPPLLPPFPDRELQESNPDEAMQMLRRSFAAAIDRLRYLEGSQLPLAIPYEPPGSEAELLEEVLGPTNDWLPYSAAYTRATLMAQLAGERPPETIIDFDAMLIAYQTGDVDDFNEAVAEYTRTIAAAKPEGLDPEKIAFETFFNQAAPFFYSKVLYIVAFVLTALSWLGWTRPLSRAALWLILLTAIAHTCAIVGRMYISGRPPVTNLYSSAVFIGFACVLLAVLLESIYKLGVGNIVATVAGYITLGIAESLAGDGDTFTVLVAVLDTQFWLATHVVCITLGYATTYVAGLLGLIYIVRGVFTPSLTPEVARSITRMTYGALCFSIFFSFWGTVLGGLWADDSWGRFWGWDPKENGALIIVLWNALVLHARWDGMVRERGLAMLAVLGNIAVSWSWFGVNELGVGLHSYGFTEGVLLTLGLFCLSQLVIVAVGSIPHGRWWSTQRAEAAKESQPA